MSMNITKPPIRELIKVKVIKITADAILVELLDFNNGKCWFPLYYVTELKQKPDLPSTMAVPTWVLNKKVIALRAEGENPRTNRVSSKRWIPTNGSIKLMHEAKLREKGFGDYNDD